MNEHDFSRLPPAAQAYIRELEAKAATNAQHIAELTERIKLLEEQFRLAQSKRFAPSSEKLKDRVFDEAEQMAAAALADDDEDDAFMLPDTGLPEPDKPAGRKRGRKPLPAELPRQRIEYDLTEDQKICPCCQGSMHRLGEEVSEQLHIEAKVSVLQHVRFKYACRHCDRNAERSPVLTAPMPAQPLPGSNASPAMLATVTIGKYVDGTPLYRMEDALGRAGIAVGRGTLANWIIRPAQLHYSRLYEALRRTLLSQPLIHADETTVQVLKEEGKAAQSKSYMWVYRSAEDCEHPVVLFDYQPGRGQEYPQEFLAGYEGMLMTDGYSAWRTLEGVTHFGCLAHARRMFVDAQKGQKKPSARVLKALEYFKALYQVETLAKAELPDGETRVDYTYQLRHHRPSRLAGGVEGHRGRGGADHLAGGQRGRHRRTGHAARRGPPCGQRCRGRARPGPKPPPRGKRWPPSRRSWPRRARRTTPCRRTWPRSARPTPRPRPGSRRGGAGGTGCREAATGGTAHPILDRARACPRAGDPRPSTGRGQRATELARTGRGA